MNAADFRRVCGPLPLDLWEDLSAFVMCWEADEIAGHMVCLGLDIGEAHEPHVIDDHQRRLEEIGRLLSEHATEIPTWPMQRGDEEEQAHHVETLREAADLERRVRDVLASITVTAKGGDA